MRLQAAAHGQRAPSHRPVCPADQPLQREDLYVHVVLVRSGRRRHRRQLLTLALAYRSTLQSDTLCPQASQGIGITT